MKNHMLRRAFSLMLCMMLVLSLLSACGKKNEAGGGASAGAVKETRVLPHFRKALLKAVRMSRFTTMITAILLLRQREMAR